MACAITSGFTRSCRDSIGGIKTVYVTELSNKSTLTYNASGVCTAFTLSSGKKFWTFELEQATATASDDPKVNASNGTFYVEHKVNFKIPKRSAFFSSQLKTLAQQDLMIIVKTQGVSGSEEYYLLGGFNGMKMGDSTASFGTAMADMNGYDLSFTGMEFDMALNVTSGQIATLTVPA
jgi:hypothetical protein